jgi:hypothetical protein
MTFYLFDVPDDTDFGLREFRDASRRLRRVAKLWKLLGSPKEHDILSFFQNLPERDRDDNMLMGAERIVPLLDALRGLEDAAKERFTDSHWRIRPEMLEFLQREAPELITWDQFTDRPWLPTLNQPLGDAQSLDLYLRDALGRPSRIAID